MTGLSLRAAAFSAAAFLLSAAGCSTFGASGDPTLREGTQLVVTDHGSDLPSSRSGYASLATFMTAGGGIQIIDPGTGPGDPPRLLRTLTLEGHVRWDAQIDDTGYLWVATPDAGGGSIRVTYVIDPHTGTVHRAIELPDALSAVASLAIGPDEVYLRAWRDGFSGGVGAVSRTCVTQARACDVRVLADLGNVGTTPERGLHYGDDDRLYVFSQSNSRNERASTLRLDPQTGDETAELTFSGESVFDDEHLYLLYVRLTGPESATRYIGRFDKATLTLEAETEVDIALGWLARDGDRLYATSSNVGHVEVYDTVTLERVETLPLGPQGRPTAAFGTLAPGVLLLNDHAWLNVETGAVVTGAFPLQTAFSQALRHAQGQPLAY